MYHSLARNFDRSSCELGSSVGWMGVLMSSWENDTSACLRWLPTLQYMLVYILFLYFVLYTLDCILSCYVSHSRLYIYHTSCSAQSCTVLYRTVPGARSRLGGRAAAARGGAANSQGELGPPASHRAPRKPVAFNFNKPNGELLASLLGAYAKGLNFSFLGGWRTEVVFCPNDDSIMGLFGA